MSDPVQARGPEESMIGFASASLLVKRSAYSIISALQFKSEATCMAPCRIRGFAEDGRPIPENAAVSKTHRFLDHYWRLFRSCDEHRSIRVRSCFDRCPLKSTASASAAAFPGQLLS